MLSKSPLSGSFVTVGRTVTIVDCAGEMFVGSEVLVRGAVVDAIAGTGPRGCLPRPIGTHRSVLRGRMSSSCVPAVLAEFFWGSSSLGRRQLKKEVSFIGDPLCPPS